MELPADTKAFNNSYQNSRPRPLGSNREPQWGKNADTPYWARERRQPSNPQYNSDWRKSEDLSTEVSGVLKRPASSLHTSAAREPRMHQSAELHN